MKIRIRGNSLRLRLSKSEVEKLCTKGSIEERISFGFNELKYSLQRSDYEQEISADYSDGSIKIHIPASLTEGWNQNDIISFDSTKKISDNETLYILIEKDFKCLDKTDEDQSDKYENPNKSC